MKSAPVWTDPDFAELLAEDPELVAIADAVQQTAAARPGRRRLRRPARLSAAAAAVAAATALVLLIPWNGSGEAAVLKRLRSALTPRPGWILHEREVIRQIEVVNGHPVTIVSESWIRYSPPYPFRELIRRPGSPTAVVAGTAASKHGQVFPDPAGELRRAVAAGDAAVAGRITIDGRSVLRVVPTKPPRYGPWIAYVDSGTFRPLRFELSGLPVRGRDGIPYPSTAVVSVTEFEYLPPTAVNLRFADMGRRGS